MRGSKTILSVTPPVSLPDHVYERSPSNVCLHRANAARRDGRMCRSAASLRDAGFNVTLVDVDDPRSHDKASLALLPQGVRVQHAVLPGESDSSLFKPWLLFLMIRSFLVRLTLLLRSRADLYHAMEVGAVLACYVAGRLRRKPVVYEVYDIPFDAPYFQTTTLRRIHRAASRRLLRWIGPSLSGVIVTSSSHGREMARLLNRAPDAIVRNIAEYELPGAHDQIRPYLGLDASTKIVLYQGNFAWERALDTLVYAAKYLEPGIVIVLRGGGPTRSDLERLIDAEGVGDRVRFAPFAPRETQMEWTSSATIGFSIYRPNLTTNVRGILPTKVFEYLMAGVPVLNTLPEVESLLQRYNVGVTISDLEPKALASAISHLVGDTEGLERMRRNALAACERELRWDVEQQYLLALYERILGGSASSLGAASLVSEQQTRGR